VQKLEKEHIFLIIVVVIGLMLIIKTVKFPVDGTVNVAIMQHTGPIHSIDSHKKVGVTKHVIVDSINFLESSVLEHPSLGNLGFSKNFFIEAKTVMRIEEKGEYQFTVHSDDGFRLLINNQKVCEFSKPRKMLRTVCRSKLEKGSHNLKLIYFQAGGQMGLKAEYRLGNVHSFIGVNTDVARFEEMK
jgi:hypothetical protein